MAFPFLAENVRGRRKAIKKFTHTAPEFVFWIYPDGRIADARLSHLKNVPKGFEHILKDEPEYGGFLRGRIASISEKQLIVVYCRSDALATHGDRLTQFLSGISLVPIPLNEKALVVSDNADIYGTLEDLKQSV